MSQISKAANGSSSSLATGKSLGVQKFCTKLRHKIEDNFSPKITGKLYKGSKHSISMCTLNISEPAVPANGKYRTASKESSPLSSFRRTTGFLRHKPAPSLLKVSVPPEGHHKHAAKSLSSSTCSTIESRESPFSSGTYTYVDSDEDEHMSLNLTKLSLEDEIFEELEKVAHDESKLNAVLKNFDKILTEHTDNAAELKDTAKEEQEVEAAHSAKIPVKKAEIQEASEPVTPAEAPLAVASSAIQTTATTSKVPYNKSLSFSDASSDVGFQNLGTTALPVPKKLEKSKTMLSMSRRNLYQSPNSPSLLNLRLNLASRPRSRSVWELPSPNAQGSKIPVLKSSALRSRSNSFCDVMETLTEKAPKNTQHPKLQKRAASALSLTRKPAPTTPPIRKPTLTTPPIRKSTSTTPPIGKQTSTTPPIGKSTPTTPPIRKFTPTTPPITSDPKLPNFGEKSPPKLQRSPTKQRMDKFSRETKRSLSTTNLHSSTRTSKSRDELLDKCLQKGQDILRKVESLNSVTAAAPRKPVLRKKSTTRDAANAMPLKKKPSVKQLKYANEEKVPLPALESCKIIPPVLGETSDKNASLLVNVVKQLPPKDSTPRDEIDSSANFIPRSASNYEHLKQVHSDNDSDDSGHISNENDATMTNLTASTSSSTASSSLCESDHSTPAPISPVKSPKICELMQKFEQSAKIPSPKSFCTTLKVAEITPIKCIKTSVDIYPTYSTEILFRSGVLSELEAKRDELLSDRIIQLQAYCRGYLARRQVAQRRVQELAVRCIQRNVKAFLAVRDWPWWRLLVRVTPLLNVHRTEEQLKTANEELLALRAKLEKIENDRNELKTENQKLEAKLSEMTVDLAEERSTANMASERLDAETAERLKLEKELNEQQSKVKNLQETSEKLEMELICAKSDLNGISEDEDPENEEGNSAAGVYKLKYERVARELEFTKRRLQTQHEHDLEQLVGLKKQLEKKLSDAYEEVEEQRQVVGQWKRKAQKMTNEMNDLRMLLEEQNARNNLLEKKQRKFDAECQALQDASRQERLAKERFSREKDVLIAEKFTLEQQLSDTRLELELKEEKLTSLTRELEEMTFGGGTEEEVGQLRRAKNELDRRVKEQEEELDEMAGQVQLLEQAKLRLEMTLETMRKEARREAQQRDEELEEARGSAYKKLKALECQLESEHEERTLLLREKHELERRLSTMEDQDRHDRQAEEAANQKLRRDLRKYKALLKDAQAQLDRLKAETPGKTLIRQLRNQLEDAESARSLAMKARQAAEAELAEVQAMFEESHRGRNDAEDRANAAHRDRAELQAQIEENEEELAELMKKYTTAVKQLNTEQMNVSEYEFRMSELEAERNTLREQVAELQQRLENVENMADPSAAMMSKRLELRTKELESRLELEQATRARLEVQMTRHKEALEKLQNELSQSKIREIQTQETLKKSQKSLRDMREEFHAVTGREQESITKRKDLEKKLEQAEAEGVALKNDLRLALQRIADLQQAMEEGDDDVSESDDSLSSEGSLNDLDSRLKPIQIKRPSNIARERNGETTVVSSTKTLVREKEDNSPRITLTSPSSPHVHKLAKAAKAADAEASAAANQHSITSSDSLKNGEASYA